MPVTRDIVDTYRGPGKVVRRLLDMGQREDRALIFVMAGCAVLYVARMPALSRAAHLQGTELNPALGGALLATLFILPLILYVLAALSHIVALGFRGKGSFYGARIALFWALLASSPLVLLNGLVAGFIGAGTELSITGGLWTLVFTWFWLRGLFVAEKEASNDG